MEADFTKYKVLILPDGVQISKELKTKIDLFLQGGGKLLATGTSGLDKETKEFAFDFGAVHMGANPYCPDYMSPNFTIADMDKADYVFYGQGEQIALNGGEILAHRRNPYFNREAFRFCSHRHTPCDPTTEEPGIVEGKDGIYISWEIFWDYAVNGSLILKRTVCYVLDRLYANTIKRGLNAEVIEDILPIYNTKVTLKTDKPVKRVYLAPQGKELEYQVVNNEVRFVVECFECHQMVVIDN